MQHKPRCARHFHAYRAHNNAFLKTYIKSQHEKQKSFSKSWNLFCLDAAQCPYLFRLTLTCCPATSCANASSSSSNRCSLFWSPGSTACSSSSNSSHLRKNGRISSYIAGNHTTKYHICDSFVAVLYEIYFKHYGL